MVLGQRGRSVSRAVFGPVARSLVRLGVSPDVVTVAGTVATAVIALSLIAPGHLVVGPLLLAFVLVSDSIDGLMARELGRTSRWGAFLDSTMDRLGDAAVYASFALYGLALDDAVLRHLTFGFAFALEPLALTVSYARARAEAVGFTASVGIAERTDRLVVTLVPAFLVGLGLPVWVLTAGLAYAALASFVTVIQRMVTVYRQDAQRRRPSP